MNTPSVGRVIHYRSHGTPKGEYESTCRAAIITQVLQTSPDESRTLVGLCAINPTGLFFHESCPQDESNTQGGTWHWPERVD
jgi:hypothetical protein